MISFKGIAITCLVIVVVCVIACRGDEEVRCIEREREALVSFKNGLIDEYDILSSWRGEECCKWDGVECSNTSSHVTGLHLNADYYYGVLRGKVTSSLLELHHLNYLDLSVNDFGGHPIPEFMGSMKQLQHLYLSDSNFSGLVPPQIGNLTKLHSLDLSFNYLRTENLDWLSGLSLLSFLDLSELDLSHTNWVQHILTLHSLQNLHLQFCNIGDVTPSAEPFVNSSSLYLSTLDLSDNHFSSSDVDELFGSLSAAKGMLESLEILDLSHNQLNGTVTDLRAFSALTQVYLDKNNFTGSVPLSLGQLSKLEVLDVSNNNLEGPVSESHLIKLGKLKVLDLSNNSLIMQITPDWNPPFQLEIVNLGGCKMGPDFPKWIQSQKKLVWLDLSSAGILEELPKWLWNFSPLLENLILSDNQINGTIPNLSSTSILRIDLSLNKLSGPVPLFHPKTHSVQLSQNMLSGSISSICKLPKLYFLDLSNNQLAGEVPDCWEQTIPCLNYLNLANNKFWGEIPHSLGSLHRLAALQLRGNNLSGELPSTLKNCTRLRLIDVGGNQLTGSIPTWIGVSYTGLLYLNLGSNKFYGSIPPQICSLTRVRILDISRNKLSGKIPDCFSNFTELADKNARPLRRYFGILFEIHYGAHPPHEGAIKVEGEFSSVQWKGQESEYRKNLDLLRLIDFSSNELTGNIPESFSSMRGLISLNLSRNGLTGNIIADIGEMEMLECLDLSQNQLSGKIPTSMAQLQHLAFLDLSNNSLWGKIPSSTQLQSFNVSDYSGNDGLCGAPLALCPQDSLRPPTSASQAEKDSGFWRLSFMQEFGISLTFGFILGFWGVIVSFILKKSWRYAYFNFLDDVGDWLHVKITIFLSKLRRS